MSAVSPLEYTDYLARFDAAAGSVEIGSFTKHEGQLIKKLSQIEFDPLQREYQQLFDTYQAALERGDTTNDLVVRLLREKAATLMKKDPIEF